MTQGTTASASDQRKHLYQITSRQMRVQAIDVAVWQLVAPLAGDVSALRAKLADLFAWRGSFIHKLTMIRLAKHGHLGAKNEPNRRQCRGDL